MKVSTKGDYGVRALVELAHRYGQGPVQSAAIASRQEIPETYLDQLLTTLRRAGFIRSVRGPQGGHSLIDEPHKVRMSDVMVALEGTLAPSACVDDPDACNKEGGCVQREVWERVRDATQEILDSVSIADLAEKERRNSHDGGRYYI
ncbi:MAG: Rrf2 family transcriptional regulator [Chloroflexi bacterium]|nr:Rrf2 family transcriptional regulator [Chloroflexota bacterium]